MFCCAPPKVPPLKPHHSTDLRSDFSVNILTLATKLIDKTDPMAFPCESTRKLEELNFLVCMYFKMIFFLAI